MNYMLLGNDQRLNWKFQIYNSLYLTALVGCLMKALDPPEEILPQSSETLMRRGIVRDMVLFQFLSGQPIRTGLCRNST